MTSGILKEAASRNLKAGLRNLGQLAYSRQPSSILGLAMISKRGHAGIKSKQSIVNLENGPASMSEMHKDDKQTDKSYSKNGGKPANNKNIHRSKFDKKNQEQKKPVQNLNAFLLDSIAYTKKFRVGEDLNRKMTIETLRILCLFQRLLRKRLKILKCRTRSSRS